MLVDVVTEFATEVVRPAAAEADEACAAPEELLEASLEIGLPILGLPESLGGVSEERSAMAGTLVAEALAKGDMGLAVAALAPGSVATAIGLWGTDEQQQTYLPGVHRRRRARPPRSRSPSRTVLFDVLSPRDHGGQAGRRLRPQRREVAGAARRRRRAVRGRRRSSTASRCCSSSSPSTDGLAVEGDPSMGVRAASLTRLTLTDVDGPARRRARRDRRLDVRRVRAALAARLVRARGRHRPGGARLRDAVRQGARGVRRAGRAPPVGGVHGRQHRDRAAGDAAADLQGRRPGGRGQGLRPRGRAGPQGRAPTRACRSASTASSCSAATASSRSTRWSGGTATSGPSASWKVRCSSDGHQSRRPEEVPDAGRPGPPGRDEHAAARSRASTTSPSTSTPRSSTCSPR